MAKSYLDKDGLLYFLQLIRANSTPSMDGTASTGTAKRFALQDHVHPSDTSKAPIASPEFTGTPTAPTATTGTSNTQIATTEFVANTVGAMTSGVSDVKVDGTSVVTNGIASITAGTGSSYPTMNGTRALGSNSGYARVDHVHPSDASRVPTTRTVNGHALSADVTITASDVSAIPTSAKGAASGVCPLNASSKIDSTYLPSYVDDVIEAYARSGQTALSQNWLATGSASGTVISPEAGKIYVLMADSGDYTANAQFRWGGTTYVKMNDGGVTAITNAEIDTIVAS